MTEDDPDDFSGRLSTLIGFSAEPASFAVWKEFGESLPALECSLIVSDSGNSRVGMACDESVVDESGALMEDESVGGEVGEGAGLSMGTYVSAT